MLSTGRAGGAPARRVSGCVFFGHRARRTCMCRASLARACCAADEPTGLSASATDRISGCRTRHARGRVDRRRAAARDASLGPSSAQTLQTIAARRVRPARGSRARDIGHRLRERTLTRRSGANNRNEPLSFRTHLHRVGWRASPPVPRAAPAGDGGRAAPRRCVSDRDLLRGGLRRSQSFHARVSAGLWYDAWTICATGFTPRRVTGRLRTRLP